MDDKNAQKRYILTVTLNPAVDTIFILRCEGGVSRIKKQVRSAGGKGINVSRAVNDFGMSTLSTGIIGGVNGHAICQLADHAKINNQFYPAVCESRNNIMLFIPVGKSRERVFPKTPAISRKEYEGFQRLYKKLLDKAEMVVLSGSVLKGVPTDVYAELIKIARRLNVPVFLDAGQGALREGLKENPDFIKPNRRETEELFRIKIGTLNDAYKAVLRLRKFKVENIFLSLGPDGAIGCNRNDLWYAKAPTVKVVNSVGCGDAFVGAVCVGFMKKLNFRECLRLAVAAGTVNAQTIIPGRINKAQVSKMSDRIIIKHFCI
ncbi:MAG: 1-phosphofructokinase family hexose kinase [Candidatus Omnitrophota bacterium]